MKRRRVAGLLLLFGVAFFRHTADAQTSTTLTVAKVQDWKQTSTSAPVQVTNPFTLTASAQAQGYTIISATFTPPGGSALNLTSISSTLFTFTSSTFATAAALNGAFPGGNYSFAVQGSAGTFNGVVPMPTSDNYPTAVPTLTNGATGTSPWTSGALQFDPTQNFLLTWNSAVSTISATEILLTITRPDGTSISFNLAAGATSQSITAGTLQSGVIYRGRLTFSKTQTTAGITPVPRATFAQVTNFTLNPVASPPRIISPTSYTMIQGQPVAYQLEATTLASYTVDQNSLPNGLSFDATTGVIFGTPTVTGTFNPVYTLTNTAGTNGGQLNVPAQSPSPGPSFADATSATSRLNQPFSFQVATTGASRSASFSATNLPAGLTINATTGLISGTVTTAGSTAVSVTVTDGTFSRTTNLQLTFVADAVIPVITSAKRITLYPGQSVSFQITADFGTSRVDIPSFKIYGTLPTGLNFDPKTGIISGVFGGQLQRGVGDSEPKFLNDSPLVQIAGTNTHGTGTSPLLFFAAPAGTVNLSTRMFVGTDSEVLIGGFIVTGTAPESVILRGIGPSLPITTALQDPVLDLRDGAGNPVTLNDNWQDDAAQVQPIKDTGVPPPNNLESAVLATFQPGNFTAIISGKNSTSGIGLVELFDLGTQTQDTTQHAKLAQISTRGTVRTGDNVMIGGFIIQGAATKTLLRGIGPELTAQGVAGALQDTTLELVNGSGTRVAFNDNWKDDATQAQAIQATGVPPTDDRESAIVITLNPGNYTAVLRGLNDTTGVALVEVYNLQ